MRGGIGRGKFASVILNEVKDLDVTKSRFFATLRMTIIHRRRVVIPRLFYSFKNCNLTFFALIFKMTQILFFLGAFLAEIAGTMVGFGSSTIFLPYALFFYDFKTALVLVAIFHIFGNLGRIGFFREGINKKLIVWFGLPSVILTLIGAFLVNYISPALLKFILGIFLLLFSLVSFIKPNLTFPASTKTALWGGGLSGFLAGLIGTGGVLRGAFLTAFNLPKTIYIATAAAIALAVDLTRLPVYFASGFLDKKFYLFIPILFLTAIFGTYVGRKIVNKIPQKLFRRMVLLAIALVSLKFILESFL